MYILIDYITHKYEYKIEKTTYYCPNCGKQSVYEEQGEGDYYVGVNYYCLDCRSYFTFQGIRSMDGERGVIRTISDEKFKGETRK